MIMTLWREMNELLEDVFFSKERQKSPVHLDGKSRDTGKAFSWSKQERNKKGAVKSYILLCFARLKPAGKASGVWGLFIVLWMNCINFQSNKLYVYLWTNCQPWPLTKDP